MAIRVFVLDARPLRLSHLRTSLSKHPLIEFAGACSTFVEAMREIVPVRPDAVVVGGDLIELPGFHAFADALMRRRIVIVPVWVFPFRQAEVSALFEMAGTPRRDETILGSDIEFLAETILGAVRRQQGVRSQAGTPGPREAEMQSRPILIGASTGGVEALHAVLSSFPADCPPVLIVQHMRPQFMSKFVAGLDRVCRPLVMEAWDGAPLERGRIYVAPGDSHLCISAGTAPACRLLAAEPRSGHRPSVDMLFESTARASVSPVAALLTGMGRDGAEGLLGIRRRGGHTIAQNKETSVVYGMPRSAVELNAAIEVLPLELIGGALLKAANAPGPECRERAIQ